MTSPEEAFIRNWLTLPDRPDVEEDELPLFMDWLEQSGPDEWHRWATGWNWQGSAAMRALADRVPWDVPDDMTAAPIQGVPNQFERTIDGAPLAMLQAKKACGMEPDGPDYL